MVLELQSLLARMGPRLWPKKAGTDPLSRKFACKACGCDFSQPQPKSKYLDSEKNDGASGADPVTAHHILVDSRGICDFLKATLPEYFRIG
jgi:hypothetical protein